jgi:exodeoxyribonuclease VII small subunit
MAEKKDSFEESMRKLEAVVEQLEKGDFTLEESLEKFEEGLALGKRCREILEKARARVKKIVEDSEGEAEEKDVSDEF